MIQVNYPTLYKIVDSDPPTARDGQLIFNSATNELKIWYAGAWHVVGSTTTPDISGGLDNLLLESGDMLLLESGTDDVLLLEG